MCAIDFKSYGSGSILLLVDFRMWSELPRPACSIKPGDLARTVNAPKFVLIMSLPPPP